MPTVPRFDLAQTTLDNGLRIVVQTDHSLPAVAVNIWYDVGSRHEQPGRTGFAHLFEHLMFQGSAHVGKAEHIAALQAIGAAVNGTTWCDRTNYFETVPSNHLELALWLEADRMGSLLDALDQANLDNQRAVVQNEKRQHYDNMPYGSASERLHAGAFPEGHPYHHDTIGSMADLDAARLDDVRAFYAAHYAPNNAVLSLVGDIEADEARRLVERYFAGIPPVEPVQPAPDGTLPSRIGTELAETVPDRVPVPRIFVGYRTPPFGTAGYDAAVLLAAVLGGGRGSRLHRELVLKRRLAQADDGGLADTWGFTGGAALLIADAAAREGVDVAELTAAYHDVAESVARDGVTDAELERAHALVEAEWLHRLARFGARADAFSQYGVLFGDPTLVGEQLPRWLAVSADDVRRAARDIIAADNRVVLTYVPDESGEAA
jgi:predicted Zn-dependent peptidase